LGPVTAFVPAPGGWLAARARDRAGQLSEVRVRYSLDGVAYRDLQRLQLDYGLASLTRDPVSAALVLRAPCTPGCEGARAALDRFMRDTHLSGWSGGQ
jgi:hypothetical protein